MVKKIFIIKPILFNLFIIFHSQIQSRTLKYGSTITLFNKNIKSYLIANNIYHNNAGQNHKRELVCGHKTKKSKWQILGPEDTEPSYKKGKPVKTGDIIRLQHVKTKKYLFSTYDAISPVRSEQEISLVPKEKASAKTNWLIVGPLGSHSITDDTELTIINDEGKEIKIENYVKLIHTRTNAPLHAGNSQLRKKVKIEKEKDHKYLHASAFTPGKRDEDNLWTMTITLESKKE